MTLIVNNPYLTLCLTSLEKIEGVLFIFGHSIRDEDDHVFDYVNIKSSVKNIFISIFGDAQADYNQKIFAKVARWEQEFTSKKYHYYYSHSANVWGRQSI